MQQDADTERTYAKVTRRLLPLLMLGYVVAYLDRVNVGFAKLQMLDELGFSETVYGLGAGIFFIGYFLCEVPSNMALARAGARRWIARIMVSWGLLSTAMMLVTTPAAFYALRFLLGAAEAGFFPGVIFYLTQWYPQARRGRIIALFMTGIPICSAIGSVLSGFIMEGLHGANGLAGWQWMFAIEGIAAVVVGVYIFFRLADRIESVGWLDAAEKAALVQALASDAASAVGKSFRDAFADRRVWLASLIYFCLISGLYGLAFWLPNIVADLGVKGAGRIGLVTAVPYTVAAVVMILTGRSADRRGERRWHVAIPAAAGALGLVLSVALSGSPPLALAALTLATAGILTALPLFWALPTAWLSGAAAAAGIAIINSFGNLAGFLSPFAVGAIKDGTGSTGLGLVTVAAFVLAGGVLVIVGTARPRDG